MIKEELAQVLHCRNWFKFIFKIVIAILNYQPIYTGTMFKNNSKHSVYLQK